MKIIITLMLLLWTSISNAQDNHINPYENHLELAQYPLTHQNKLDEIADSALKNNFTLNNDSIDKKLYEENRQNILDALILNPNCSDNTLQKISVFLLKKAKINEDIFYSIVSHKNISKTTISNIAKLAKNNPELKTLYQFCQSKLEVKP